MESVVYTIGNKMAYDAGLSEGKFTKPGKNAEGKSVPHGYTGGIVFKTKKNAKRYIDEKKISDYAIYEVEADWISDCEINEDDGEKAFWKHLLKTSTILRKVSR